jgi:hypothetical protein
MVKQRNGGSEIESTVDTEKKKGYPKKCQGCMTNLAKTAFFKHKKLIQKEGRCR